MSRPPFAALALVLALLAVTALGLALGSRPWFPEVVSAHGRGLQRMLDFTLASSASFFVLGHLALAYVVARAALRPGAASEHPRRQWLVAFVPAAAMAVVAEGGVIALGLPVFGQYYGPAPADAVRVEVTGRQFFWAVHYPGADGVFGVSKPELMTSENALGLDAGVREARDDLVMLNELSVPAGRPVSLTLRSADVIHSFFVRELRLKQDAMPGMTIRVWFLPTKAGDYEIACNQICGLGHYRMRATLHVLEPAAFQTWLSEQEPFASERPQELR